MFQMLKNPAEEVSGHLELSEDFLRFRGVCDFFFLFRSTASFRGDESWRQSFRIPTVAERDNEGVDSSMRRRVKL